MKKIKPYLWFNTNAEEAMNFYVDIFNNSPSKKEESKILHLSRFPDEAPSEYTVGLEGKVAHGVVMLDGLEIGLFDGGPAFVFNEAMSLYIECDTQEEIDYFWNAMSAVPDAEACGWLKDKFGVSWQIAPKVLVELMSDTNSEKSARTMKSMLGMKKMNIAELRRAYDGE